MRVLAMYAACDVMHPLEAREHNVVNTYRCSLSIGDSEGDWFVADKLIEFGDDIF